MSPYDAFLLTGVSVFDGTGTAPTPDRAVAIEGRRIQWIGPASEAPPFPSERVLDGQDGTLIPGLINSHAHIAGNSEGDRFVAIDRDDSTPIATVRAVTNLRLALSSGVTTIRDCGAPDNLAIELSKAVDEGMLVSPRIRAAGRPITNASGHGRSVGRQANGPSDVTQATLAELKEGAHFIKLMATGGVLSRDNAHRQPALGISELTAAARVAHDSGRRVASHAIGVRGVKNAQRAKVDSIEHGLYLDAEALELAVDQGTFLVPTLVALQKIEANRERVLAWLAKKLEVESDAHRHSFLEAVRSGMKIAAGTDAGSPFNSHREFASELELMVEYGGLSPAEVLVAATRNGAENLDLLHEIGTIETGSSPTWCCCVTTPLSTSLQPETWCLLLGTGPFTQKVPKMHSRIHRSFEPSGGRACREVAGPHEGKWEHHPCASTAPTHVAI